MPRAVIAWLRCDACGNNPAARECRGMRLCERCFHAIGPQIGCTRPRPGGEAIQAAEVDEELIAKIKRRAYRRK